MLACVARVGERLSMRQAPATGEATWGHNAVRDLIFEFSLAADATTEKEPAGLISSRPTLRPADVLSPAAVSGRMAALDIGITSVEAAPEGDAAEVMFMRKSQERAPFEREFAAQNIVYRPMVWTIFGRPLPATLTMLRAIAKRVPRRRGYASQAVLLKQLLRKIGAELARRAARMSLACWPVDRPNG